MSPPKARQPGAQFLAEIREQPRALERLLEREPDFGRVAAIARERGTTIRLIGHGSSDNAAAYGMYAFGLLPGWTAMRDSITLSVYYKASVDVSGSTVIALSQSGKTRDVIEYVARAREKGAFTVAVTNDPASELAQAAEEVLALGAGMEKAVAATKTYTNQIAALALLAAHAAGQGPRYVDGLRDVIQRLDSLIPELEQVVVPLAMQFAFVGRMFVIGRGTEFATAREIALKLIETCRVAAEPLTATQLAHGPVAALDSLFPVWAIASRDETLPSVVEAAGRIQAAGATLLASGTAAGAIVGADHSIPIPMPSVPMLAPILSVVPGQLFAWALARAKGLDPDVPRGLSKVTLAL